MKRILPSLPLSLTVFLLWLLLISEISAGGLLMAAALAIALPMMAATLRPPRANFGNIGVALRLAVTVGFDIVVSNIEVARRILGPQSVLAPAFIWVPLDIKSEHGMTTLAAIITLTPGTVSAELAEDQRHLLVHCFNVGDAGEAIARIKARYEAPLMEVFR